MPIMVFICFVQPRGELNRRPQAGMNMVVAQGADRWNELVRSEGPVVS